MSSLKGLRHEMEFKYFGKNGYLWGLNNSIYMFLNFKPLVSGELLMSCCLYYFPHAVTVR